MKLRRFLRAATAIGALVAGVAILLAPGSIASAVAADEMERGQPRVARGQIIVHLLSREAHAVPSPAGDPNTYLQTTLFQDFTGDFTGSGTAIFIVTTHHDGTVPDGTTTFTGREAEFGTMFGHTGAFYFDDKDGLITTEGKVSGRFKSDGGILGFQHFHAAGNFFPTPNPSVSGNLSHTVDYEIRVSFE
jgi:hypothetical protein